MRKYISTKCHCKFSSCTRKYRILLRYVLELCAFKLFRFFFVFSFSFILFNLFCVWNYSLRLNRLTANPTKWSNTLKQFAGNLPTNCLSVFNHFVKLTLKGPKRGSLLPKFYCDCNLNSTESYKPPLKFMETWWILNYFIFKMETYLFWIFWGSWFSWGLPGFYGNL